MTLRVPLKVRYAETDAMGVVHHSRYIPWLELARVEWLERLGLPYLIVDSEARTVRGYWREGTGWQITPSKARFLCPVWGEA